MLVRTGREFAPLWEPQTLDRTTYDRNHLTTAKVDRLVAATKGRRNEALAQLCHSRRS
jgi:hypothetical protein